MPSIMLSDIQNRVSKIKLSKDKFLMPIFEALSNSFQAIEDKYQQNTKEGKIKILFNRDDTEQKTIENIDRTLLHIKNVTITDNGIGFNNENYVSFRTYDSMYKKQRGGKGEGRLYWLKVFDNVTVQSFYSENDEIKEISFPFCFEDNGIDGEKVKINNATIKETGTTINLQNLKNEYKDLYLIQLDTIAKRIINHFVSYFIDDNCPEIIIQDESEKIILNDYFKQWICGDIFSSDLTLKKEQFKLLYIKLKEYGNSNHKLHLCADKREVISYNLKDYIPDLYSKLGQDNEDKYYYHVFVYSDYLNQLVRSDRSDFQTKDDNINMLYSINFDDILKNLILNIKQNLKQDLEQIKADKFNKITNYIRTAGYQYRILLNPKYKDRLDDVKPNSSGKDLELELYEIYYQLDKEIKKDAKKLIKTNLNKVEDKDFFYSKIKEYLEKISEFGKSKLADYVVHRKALLDLLFKLQKEKPDGKYALEDAIHDTIFPMHNTSDDIDYTQHNLWAIDEKLAYHYYLASDIKLNKYDVIESSSENRPDIAIFDNPIAITPDEKISAVTLVEFKRPERDDYTEIENPIKQIIDYVKLLRAAKKKSKDGETINITDNTPIYAYIIATITPTLKEIAKDKDFLTISSDGLGYFGYHSNHKIYFEIISYKKMLQDAFDRNKILFEKLNLL